MPNGFSGPIRELSEKYTIFQNAMASSERIFHLLDTQPTVVSAAPKSGTSHLKGEIEFRNVWFAYNDDDYVLRDVSFKVKPGGKGRARRAYRCWENLYYQPTLPIL